MLLFWLLGCAACGPRGLHAAEVQLISADLTRTVVEIILDTFTVGQTAAGTSISSPACHPDQASGAWPLPMLSVSVGIPGGGEPVVRAVVSGDTTLTGISLTRNTGTVFPAPEVVRGTAICLMRDQRIINITLALGAYSAATQTMILHRTVRLEVQHPSAATGATMPDGPFEELLRARLVNYENARKFRQPPGSALLPKAAAFYLPDPSYKISVTQDGVCRLTYAYLAANSVNLAGVDPRTLKIYFQGHELPIYVRGENDRTFDPGDDLIFYGTFRRGENSYYSPYTRANTYYLTWGGALGARMTEHNATVSWIDLLTTPATGSYRTTVHFEEQNIFGRDPDRNGWDYYYWTLIGGQDLSYLRLDLPFPAASANDHCTFRIGLQGTTTDNESSTQDHHFQFSVNNKYLGEIRWDGTSYAEFTSPAVPNYHLTEGDSGQHLLILGPKDTPGRAGLPDQAYIDWIEVDYWREYRARANQLVCTNDFSKAWGTQRYFIDGFTTPDVALFDLAGRRLTGFVMTPQKRNDTTYYCLAFQDEVYDTTRYLAVSPDSFRPPAAIERNTATANPFTDNGGADYVIITHRKLALAAESLRAYRHSHGLTAKTFYIDDIYYNFSQGIEDPAAIKAFLQTAYTAWTQRPAYVLLLGDAAYNYSMSDRNLVPTYLVQTPKWGMTASDNWFACLAGDDPVPDLMIGRLPAETADEAQAMVRKIIHYEQAPVKDAWRRNVLLLAGGDETKTSWGVADYFVQSSEGLGLDPGSKVHKVYTVAATGLEEYQGGKSEVINYINQGMALVNFTGHGGGSIWADKDLLNLGDVATLTNADRLPLVTSLTCFTGFFDNPSSSSLGEKMIKAAHGGAIGFVGASGYGWKEGNQSFNQEIFSSIYNGKVRALGAILNDAKLGMHQYDADWDDRIVVQYNLLGDPACRLAFPDAALALECRRPSLAPGETLRVTGRLPWRASGQVLLETFIFDDSLIDTRTIPVANADSFTLAVRLASTLHRGPGRVRAYYWGGPADASGSMTFNVQEPYLAGISHQPAPPYHNDSVRIVADAALYNAGIDSVVCLWKKWTDTVWERIRMDSIGNPGIYRTPSAIVRTEGDTINYRVALYYNAGQAQLSGEHTYIVLHRADVRPDPASIVLAAADTQVTVSVRVDNLGDRAVDSCKVRFLTGPSGTWQQLGADHFITQLDSHATVRVAVDFPVHLRGRIPVTVQIDPDSVLDEVDRANNLGSCTLEVNLFTVTPSGGTSGPAFSLDSACMVTLLPQAVDTPRVMAITAVRRDSLNPQRTQPDFFRVDYPDTTVAAYRVAFLDTTGAFLRPACVRLRFRSTDSLTAALQRERKLALCQWRTATEQWVRVPAGSDTMRRADSAWVNGPGIFGLFVCNDSKGPDLGLMVEDQSFASGDYATSRPTLSATLTDENGVDPDAVFFFLNQEQVAAGDFVVAPGQGNPHLYLASYKPHLDPGTYTLKVTACDNALNQSAAELRFTVAAHFAVPFIANHPNPFWEKTVIAYTVSGLADEVTLKLYTAGGRLVKTFKRYAVIGYNEEPWDARDEDGHLVANGVYYLKIIAKQDGKTVEKRTKVAFMRR
jgi:hypothetical protein